MTSLLMHKNSLPLAALVLSIALHGALLCLWPQQGRVGVAPARVLYVEFAAGVPKAGEPESQVRSAPGHRSERKVAASRSRPFHGVTEVAPAAIPASPESPPGGARQAVLSAEAAAERAMPAHAVINAKTDSQAARNEADLLAGYGQALSRAIARQQRYPRIAQVKGWQGTVEIAMQIAPGTRLQQVTVLRSSGFDVLDQHALEMVRDAAPLPPAPEPLRSSEFSVRMPIVFRLND